MENKKSSRRPIVLLLTGPCGVGKTAISKIIASRNKFILISGDKIKKELFPNIEKIEEHPKKLSKIKNEILKRTKINFKNGNSVIVDYMVLGKDYLDRYKKEFGKRLVIKILLPSKKVTLIRDKNRKCWTAGEECIDRLYKKFKKSEYFSKKDYINNSEKTYIKYFKNMK
jgi:dephospho-CoA kinase